MAEGADRPTNWPGFGRVAPPPFRLIILPDSSALAAVTGRRVPEWSTAVTLPASRTVFLRADTPNPERALRHEVGHLVLHSRIRIPVPLWFDEGYAAWASGELERYQALELHLAVASGSIPPLDELNRMLRGQAASADVAYSLAATAVAALAGRSPPGALERLIAGLESGQGFGESLLAATGLTEDRFEEAWQEQVRRRYSLINWLTAGGLWTLVAVAIVFATRWRRRADRPRREALDEGWPEPESGPEPVDQRAANE